MMKKLLLSLSVVAVSLMLVPESEAGNRRSHCDDRSYQSGHYRGGGGHYRSRRAYYRPRRTYYAPRRAYYRPVYVAPQRYCPPVRRSCGSRVYFGFSSY